MCCLEKGNTCIVDKGEILFRRMAEEGFRNGNESNKHHVTGASL